MSVSKGVFRGEFSLKYISNNFYQYVPEEKDPLTYVSSRQEVFVLDEKMDTDLASVPRVFWSIPGFAPDTYARPAIVHDWLFEQHHRGNELVTFHRANELLEEMIVTESGLRWNAFAYRVACDLAGRSFWDKGKSNRFFLDVSFRETPDADDHPLFDSSIFKKIVELVSQRAWEVIDSYFSDLLKSSDVVPQNTLMTLYSLTDCDEVKVNLPSRVLAKGVAYAMMGQGGDSAEQFRVRFQ